jgi:hypothetical protein
VLEQTDVRKLEGGCRCGAVRYRVTDAFSYGLICHCSQCRKTTGAANKPFLGIEIEQFELTHGEEVIQRFGDDQGYDARCAKCGCFLYSVVRDGRNVHVTMGSLIDTPTRRPNGHIFVGSKAEWETIEDDLPQFEEYPT